MEIFRDLISFFEFPVVYTHTTAKGSEWAPTPSSNVKILSKRDGHLGKDIVALGFWRYFRRKAGGPARLRSASVVQSRFILMVFQSFSDVDQSLGVAWKTKPFQTTKS